MGLVLALGLTVAPAHASTLTTLHSFSYSKNDGYNPLAGVILGSDGTIYGNTSGGGANSGGIVFQIDGAGKFALLYSFLDGASPVTPLLLDTAGDLFGTDQRGAHKSGEVFELSAANTFASLMSCTAKQNDKDGGSASAVIADKQGRLYGTTCMLAYQFTPPKKLKTLQAFHACDPSGSYPSAGLLSDNEGNLYGATLLGGANNFGSIYEISKAGVETTLYSFTNGTDGEYPIGTLVADAAGNLYGVTRATSDSDGTVFKLSTNGNLSTVHNFGANANGPDGSTPNGSLVIDGAGNLFGTTKLGGTGGGTIFEISTAENESVLYAFPGTASPSSPLAIDAAGNLYGATEQGGTNNVGTVFKLTP
jgi:uncharacterized repeat protein (TIGR03803 family)